jgi:TrkA-C domain
MSGIYFILPTLLVILISFLVVRAGAIALMMTGMDEQTARFQALSAYTGTGFTTKEAETVVSNFQRRRIVMWLMIIGYAGIVTVIVTATSSFISSHGFEPLYITLVLIAGVFLMYQLFKHTGLTRKWEGYIRKRFAKSYSFEEGTPEQLLHLLEGFGLVRITVTPDWPLETTCISEETCRINNLQVIGIERENHWIPLPAPEEPMKVGDKVVIYGQLNTLNSMFSKIK